LDYRENIGTAQCPCTDFTRYLGIARLASNNQERLSLTSLQRYLFECLDKSLVSFVSLDCAKRQEYVAIVRHTELRSGFVAGNRVRIEARISRVGDVKDLVPRQGIVTLKNLVGPFGHDMNQISFLRNQLSNLEILLRPPRIMWKCIVDSPHNLASL